MAPALEVSRLDKRYGSRTALDGVDLELEPGRLLGLIGPNGAGKSTLTKIACGLVRATRGTARCLRRTRPAPPRRAAASATSRSSSAFRASYRGRAAAPAPAARRLGRRRAPSARELLELVGLADAAGRRIQAMSKGMQQRLGIAQALVGAPRAAPARRADERARPGRTPRRARPPAAAARRGHRRAPQLAPPERARARLRPHRVLDHGARRRRGLARRAHAPARRRDRDDRRDAHRRRRRARRRAGARPQPRRGGRAGLGVRILRSTLEEAYLELVGEGSA